MKKPYASLIISIYNKIDYLKLLFSSLERQTFSAFEIIIADDGSNDCVVNELSNLVKKIDLNTKHVWHDDQGWRKPEILNKAILASSSDYLIFIDGDCILHSHFIEEHFYNKKSGVALKGWWYSGLLSIVFCETFYWSYYFFRFLTQFYLICA